MQNQAFDERMRARAAAESMPLSARYEKELHRTLSTLSERAKYKPRLRAALVWTLLTLLTASAALAAANHFGLLDFIGWRFEPSHREQIEAMVESDVAQQGGETAHARVRVLQAVSDGGTLEFTLLAQAKDENEALYNEDTEGTEPDALFFACQIDSIGGEAVRSTSYTFLREDARTLVYHISVPHAKADNAEVILSCLVYNDEIREETALTFRLPENAEGTRLALTHSILTESGEIIHIECAHTPLGLRYAITLAVPRGLPRQPFFIGESGEILENFGDGARLETTLADGRRAFILSDACRTGLEPPESLTLWFYGARELIEIDPINDAATVVSYPKLDISRDGTRLCLEGEE